MQRRQHIDPPTELSSHEGHWLHKVATGQIKETKDLKRRREQDKRLCEMLKSQRKCRASECSNASTEHSYWMRKWTAKTGLLTDHWQHLRAAIEMGPVGR